MQHSNGARELRMAKWGFVPFFMDGKPGKRPPPINARAETLATSGMFRSSVAKYRCIIPADGFYEWKMIDPDTKTKQPMYVQLQDTSLFGFAGIYTLPTASNPGGTAAIITTTPNELMASIHNRMPAILLPALEDVWLDPKMTDTSEALTLAHAVPGRCHDRHTRQYQGEHRCE